MSRAIKFKNDTYVDSSGIVYRRINLQGLLDRFMWGKTREVTVKEQYVRLFTITLNAAWKAYSVVFILTDTQARL